MYKDLEPSRTSHELTINSRYVDILIILRVTEQILCWLETLTELYELCFVPGREMITIYAATES